MKNKNIILTSITALTLIVPALADPVTPNIAVGTNPADCTEPVLGTTSGTSNLEANWNANTLYLSWSVDGTPYATNDTNAAACTYDQGITIPTNPTKTGYTFAGWKVKLSNILASLNISIDGEDGGYINDSRGEYGARSDNADTYGLTEDNTWATEFSYGTVYGEASCVALDADMAYLLNNMFAVMEGEMNPETFLTEYTQLAGAEKAGILQDIYSRMLSRAITEDEGWDEVRAKLLSSDDNTRYNKTTTGQNCFCKATGYTPLNGTKQNVAASRWVFDDDRDSAASCANDCANNCVNHVRDAADFRSAVFNSAQ